jgi:hypothetical protein
MQCTFCDKDGQASVEHVVPRWTGPILLRLPRTGVNPGGKLMTHLFTPGPEEDTPAREWENDEPDLTTTSVCLDCNNGWLAKMEDAVSSIAEPLLLGEPVSLGSEDQCLLATWSYKTVLLFQKVRPRTSRPIPDERFRELYALRRPPTDVRVWLASAQGNNVVHETSTEINLARKADQLVVPGFFTALAIGRLLVLCAGRLSPGPEQIQIGSEVNRRISVQVWPASLRTLQWPPPEPLEDLQPKSIVGLL